MYVLILVCLSIVGFTQAQQERCCFPEEQFTISKGFTTASTLTTYWGKLEGQLQTSENQDLAYDFTNNRFAVKIYRSFKYEPYFPQHFRIVEDANEQISYVINLDKETCTKESTADFPFHLDQCIPDYFETTGPIQIGDNELELTNWTYSWTDEYGAATYSYSVSPRCIPVVDTLFGQVNTWKADTRQIILAGRFYNYKVGIEDPDSFFSLPDYCNEKQQEEKGEESGFFFNFNWLG